MREHPVRSRDPSIRALIREIAEAEEPRIIRIVATVDAMRRRGSADQLIASLRGRLVALRPPRPLRFPRLMFHPLGPLIIPAGQWRPQLQAIPRTALTPMAEHVRLAMGADARAIEQEISGATNADRDLIARLGRSVWPVAARILAGSKVPDGWSATELGVPAYRRLADLAAALLAHAVPLDTLRAEIATGPRLLRREAIEALLRGVSAANQAALPAMLTLLLSRVPDAATHLPRARAGSEAAMPQAAMDQATDLLLRHLDQDQDTEARIAAGTLADAGAAVNHLASLLRQLEDQNPSRRRREQIRTLRQRLDTSCKARFASTLQDGLLAPLRHLVAAPDGASVPAPSVPVPHVPAPHVPALEAVARGLRVLETEARVVGGGPTYDLLLRKAAEAIKCNGARDGLALADQLRLVEILAGSEAALAMLDMPA